MFKIELFHDLPDKQSLQEPMEITVSSYIDLIKIITEIQVGDIKYDWSRIIITKVE